MNMKKYLVLFLTFLILTSIKSQNLNINPDKNGEPWIVGGLRVPTEEEIASIKVLENISEKNKKSLPQTLDNTQKMFFRPIFNQSNGSCAQASGIAYNFTYEINRIRNTDASILENQYPSHFTYNFLNGGNGDNGSWYSDGWNIIKANGCPNSLIYGGLSINETFWMNGYGNYESAMENRVHEQFAINVSTPEGLTTLKYWLFDHLEGSETGGLANFSAGVTNEFTLSSGNKITHFGHTVNHAMTIVGWNDNIEFDFNGDGQITTNVDINEDNIVDMRDWEKGALIMVNSWGTSWANGGKAYIMYKLLAEPAENGGILSGKVFSILVKSEYSPLLILKTKINHSSRNKLSIKAGISSDINSTVPDYILDFPVFNFQGGSFQMNGSNTTPLEISLDITPLLSYVESDSDCKIFLGVYENDPNDLSTGKIWEYKVEDTEQNNDYTCNNEMVTILNNSFTWLSVNVDINFDSPAIVTQFLPVAFIDEYYQYQLIGDGGEAPYKFSIKLDYEEETLTSTFPLISSVELTPTNQDDGVAVLDLDFDFPYYGKNYNQIVVNTDGSIIFVPEFDFLRTPEMVKQTKMIAVFASDLMFYPEDNDGIFYEMTDNYVIIRWKSSLFDVQEANIDVALKLFSSGEIEFYYGGNITDNISWVSGVSNGDLLNYSFYSNSGIGNPQNTMFKFVPQSFPIGMEITEDGVFKGLTVLENFTWDINFVITDNKNISKIKTISFSNSATQIFENLNEKVIFYYPNPFNDYINFVFVLDSSKIVTLEVFDITGKKIETFANNQFLEKGNYNFRWNITSEIKSGIYIYKLILDDKKYTGSILKN